MSSTDWLVRFLLTKIIFSRVNSDFLRNSGVRSVSLPRVSYVLVTYRDDSVSSLLPYMYELVQSHAGGTSWQLQTFVSEPVISPPPHRFEPRTFSVRCGPWMDDLEAVRAASAKLAAGLISEEEYRHILKVVSY